MEQNLMYKIGDNIQCKNTFKKFLKGEKYVVCDIWLEDGDNHIICIGSRPGQTPFGVGTIPLMNSGKFSNNNWKTYNMQYLFYNIVELRKNKLKRLNV